MIRSMMIVTFGIAALLAATAARAQPPAGYELALVDVDGSPDGRGIAFEMRDRSGPDGPRLWTDGLRLAALVDVVVRDHATRSGDLPRSAAGAGTGERAGELCAPRDVRRL
ncbi:MAG TPA: hypothetical protein VGF24_27515 [Vicinamibacterales bacterium]|jgi:hypothetical protein